jgi:hypothetical protein
MHCLAKGVLDTTSAEGKGLILGKNRLASACI